MKQVLIFLTLILVLISCNQEERISEQIMNEWITFYNKEDIDLKTELNAFESALIKEGYLKDRTSKSYKALYGSLSEEAQPKIKLPKDVSLACVKINKKTETPLLTKIKFFSQLEELIEQEEYYKHGWKNYPFLGVADLITKETINNDVIKSYLLLNLMVVAVDLSAELKLILPKPTLTGGEEVIFESLEQISFREKSYNIEEFEAFIRKTTEDIKTLTLIANESVKAKDLMRLMNICKEEEIKLTFKTKKDKN